MPSAIFLRHDRAGDQRDRLDRAGHVAQGVELAVGRGQVAARRADDRADVGRAGARRRSRDRSERNPGIASSLSRVPPVWPEPAPGELRHGRPAGGHQRAQRQGDLVADAAGGVLVDRRPTETDDRSRRVARADHRVGPGGQLARGQAAEEDGHAAAPTPARRPRSPRGVGVEEPADLLVGEVGRRRAWPRSPRRRRCSPARLAARGRRRGRRRRGAGRRGSWAPPRPGPPRCPRRRARDSSWRQRPQGASGAPSPATTPRPPAARRRWRQVRSQPHSAQSVRPSSRSPRCTRRRCGRRRRGRRRPTRTPE